MGQYPQPRIRAAWGRSDRPITAVTVFTGFIKRLSETWTPSRRSASSAAQMPG